MGAAMAGLRPVAEIMFSDFYATCWDQVVNEVAKTRYMTGGQVTVPLVLRGANGFGSMGFGSQHGQACENWAMTVPGLKHARHLVNVIRERLPDGPPLEVIVNRFEQRLFGPGLRRADIEQALGDSLAATIPNNFRLVSEAIDRGVPLDEVKAGNNIATPLNKLIFPPKSAKGAKPVAGERKLALAR